MSVNTLSSLTPMLLFLLLLVLLSSSQHLTTASGCLNQHCGTGALNVSYPFALDDQSDCPAFSDFFRLHCNESASKVFINISRGNNTGIINDIVTPVEVTHITNDSLVIDVTSLRATLRYNTCDDSSTTADIHLPSFPSPFVISNDNQFGGFGCSSTSVFVTGKVVNSSLPPIGSPSPAPGPALPPLGSPSQAPVPAQQIHEDIVHLGSPPQAPAPAPAANDDGGYDHHIKYEQYGGCLAISCQDNDKDNGLACGNYNCCVSNLTSVESSFRYAYFDIGVYAEYYDLVCAPGEFVGFSTFFHSNYTDFDKESYQLLLKWALPSNQTQYNIMQSPDYACSPNSFIKIVEDVPGYLCSCKPGYMGDGYLNGFRCTDVNECDLAIDDCVSGSRCHNVEGNYTCKCNGQFYVGDGHRSGSGCQFSNSVKLALAISSASVSLLLIIGSSVCLAMWWRQRTKRKYFMQNGGLEMQAFLGARPGRQMTRLFKSEDLKAATNNYAEHMKIGSGGFGMVFKGVLDDGGLVAIKKAKNMGSKDGADSRQFLNEMAILTQINHRHIVRLLGCCLETEVPLLVYEYVSNGNVAENLEAERGTCAIMSWEQRLKVARQTAEALAYLHAAASPPILHRDVKSANVLLDDNFDAKVADFGLSRLVPDGVQHISTAVQGTIGYLDPEYFQTLQLTGKSDVYSLGVMLTELITGLKPVDTHNREPRFANLASLFIQRMQEDKLDELIDARFTEASGDATLRIHSSIMAVAALACQCLALEGSMRPSMSQLADELRHISQSLQARAGNESDDEAAPLLCSRKEVVEYDVEPGAAILKEFQSMSIDTMLFGSTSLAR